MDKYAVMICNITNENQKCKLNIISTVPFTSHKSAIKYQNEDLSMLNLSSLIVKL